MGLIINKGVGQPLDFFGLKSQYIIYFMVGIVLAFVAFFALQYVQQYLGVAVGGVLALICYLVCNWANTKYGINGVSRTFCSRRMPRRVSPRRAMYLIEHRQ